MSDKSKKSEGENITDELVAQAAMSLLSSGSSLDKVEMSRELRSRVREFLAQVAGFKASDVSVIAERTDLVERLHLESQYEERADALFDLIQKGVFVEGTPMPTREKVLNSFSARDLELAAEFQEPTLLLVPETSFKAKVKALDATRTIEGQHDAYVDGVYKDSGNVSEKITGWRVVIVDGASEMKPKEGDNAELKYTERIRNRKAARRPGEKGVDRHIQAMLVLDSLWKGKPIDQETGTLLDDDPALSAYRVPVAFWYAGYRQVHFRWGDPDSVNNDAHWRSSVGGDVKF